MDISASKYSSGCESGWTLYFDESSQSQKQYQKNSRKGLVDHRQQSFRPIIDDEEDLSMVSDASSGPPLFHYQDQGEYDEFRFFQQSRAHYPSSSSSAKSKKKKAQENPRTNNQHFLDDTASSHDLSYTNRCLDPSSNQPSLDNLFRGNSAFGDQLGCWQPSHGRQQEQAEPSRSRGRRRG